MTQDNDIERKDWEEFQKTGLLLFVNTFLHIFGWSIVLSLNEERKVVEVYPARVKFRGFNDASVSSAYLKLSTWMKDNAEILEEEAK